MIITISKDWYAKMRIQSQRIGKQKKCHVLMLRGAFLFLNCFIGCSYKGTDFIILLEKRNVFPKFVPC